MTEKRWGRQCVRVTILLANSNVRTKESAEI